MRKIITSIHVRAISMRSTRAVLSVGSLTFPCLVGRTGRRHLKVEGDGATPVGCWSIVELLHRGDRMLPPRSAFRSRPLRPSDGWCDAVGDRNYNRLVRRPYPASHEEMCRGDGLYDIVVVLSHNSRPRVQGGGSAVFFHLSDQRDKPTAGCIALSQSDMAILLSRCGRHSRLVVWSSSGPP